MVISLLVVWKWSHMKFTRRILFCLGGRKRLFWALLKNSLISGKGSQCLLETNKQKSLCTLPHLLGNENFVPLCSLLTSVLQCTLKRRGVPGLRSLSELRFAQEFRGVSILCWGSLSWGGCSCKWLLDGASVFPGIQPRNHHTSHLSSSCWLAGVSSSSRCCHCTARLHQCEERALHTQLDVSANSTEQPALWLCVVFLIFSGLWISGFSKSCLSGLQCFVARFWVTVRERFWAPLLFHSS